MVQASDIREHMEVFGSDGVLVGIVDHVDNDQIKLRKADFADQHHHYVALATVSRVDSHVHLSVPASAALVGAERAGSAPYVTAAEKRRGVASYLPWLLLALAILVLLLLAKSCAHRQAPRQPSPPRPRPRSRSKRSRFPTVIRSGSRRRR